MKPFDVFLVAAPKDYSKIEFCIQGIVNNVSGFENIYLCTPNRLDQKIVESLHYPIHYRIDMEVLRAQPNRWKYRPNWVYQQFIKLFQNETKNDWYLVVDIDTIINKKLPMWNPSNDNQPIWYVGWEQNNAPYYRFNQKMMGYGRVYDHTFLADMGFYSKKLVTDMLEFKDYTKESFIQKSYSVVSGDCYPSEADLYMGYVWLCRSYYEISHLHTKMDAREGDNPSQQLWLKKDIEDHIKKMKGTDYQTFSMHSWVNKSHGLWTAK